MWCHGGCLLLCCCLLLSWVLHTLQAILVGVSCYCVVACSLLALAGHAGACKPPVAASLSLFSDRAIHAAQACGCALLQVVFSVCVLDFVLLCGLVLLQGWNAGLMLLMHDKTLGVIWDTHDLTAENQCRHVVAHLGSCVTPCTSAYVCCCACVYHKLRSAVSRGLCDMLGRA